MVRLTLPYTKLSLTAYGINYILIPRLSMHTNPRYKGDEFMKINKKLIKGSTSTLVLSLLNQRPMYGYEIIKVIEVKSGGVFSFKEGTLYPILHSLEGEELIEAYWSESEEGRKRKYYKITNKGKSFMEEKKSEWSLFKTSVDKILLEEFSWE